MKQINPVVSPYSLTLSLAYIHHYTPVALPGRWLPSTHLRHLSHWIGWPTPQLRSARDHPALAAHLALTYGTQLLHKNERSWTVSPSIMTWLHSVTKEQIEPCLTLLDDPTAWKQVVGELGLETTIGLDYHGYLRQTLIRQLEGSHEIVDEPAYWLPPPAGNEAWWLCLPATLPAWLLFDLLQLGEWMPGSPMKCTATSLISAASRGYGSHHIRWLLETATQKPLPSQYEKQMEEWLQRGQTYQVQQVTLLSTRQPKQMKEILAQKRWRPFFGPQVSPRHVTVHTNLLPQLASWLKQKGQHLDDNATSDRTTAATSPAYHWLGVRVLIGLGELINLPYPPPHQELQTVEQQLSPIQRSELEDVAQTLLGHMRTAINGRDAFWPANRSSVVVWLAQIEKAIEKELILDIIYQSLGEFKPAYRKIQPLRLEQQGSLYYLHAYCYRVEANLVFRLDRIHEILTT